MPDREPALLRDDADDGRGARGVPLSEPAAHPEPAREPARAGSKGDILGAAGDLPSPATPATPRRAHERSRDVAPKGERGARAGTVTVHVAGFWRRLAAAMVDLVIVAPVALILTWIASLVAGVHLPPSRTRGIDFWLDLALSSDPALLMAFGLLAAVGLVYLLVFQITTARTVGMRLLGLRIIDLYGDPPTSARCAVRTLGYLAGAATLLLGFLWIGFDSEKRGLHDWLAGTYVIKA